LQRNPLSRKRSKTVSSTGGFTLKEAAALAERLSEGETKIEVELVAD